VQITVQITANKVQITANKVQITANKVQNQVIQYILSFMLKNLLELTYLQKDTVHLHVLEGITQTVVIGSATNATKEAVTRTILANLTCSGGNYNQCTACNSGSFLYPNTGGECINPCPNGFWGDTSTNTCQPCYSSGSGPYYTCVTCSAGGSSNCDSCNSLTFLYNSQCINPCPAGYWGNNPGYFLYPNTGSQCLKNLCPAGCWGSTKTNILCMILCMLFVLFDNEK